MQSTRIMASVPTALPFSPFLTSRNSSYSMVPVDEHELSSIPVSTPSRTIGRSVSAQSDTIPLLNRLGSQENVQKLPPPQRKESKHRYFQGWHMGVTLCAFTAGTVLIINVLVTIWGTARLGVHGSLVTLQDGDCSKTKKLSLWLHLAINILSTLLLGASNYCMQCLSSPSRAEIDSAHSQHVWLDIGVPSVRNLRRVSWNKIILWWLFAISTIPLHLLYNSAIFSTIGANDYNVYIGSENVVTGVGFNWSLPFDNPEFYPNCKPEYPDCTLRYFQQAANWTKLTNEECIKLYSQDYVTGNSNVLAVTPALNDSSPLLNSSYPVYIYNALIGWECSGQTSLSNTCDTSALIAEAANWTITTVDTDADNLVLPIQYCLSQKVDGHCTLQFSLLIIIIVIFCNITKLACMVMLLLCRQAKPLVTLGDAVESFLATPDVTTDHMCLTDKSGFSSKNWSATRTPYEPKQPRWFASASWKRWLTCNILCVSTLIVAGVLLSQGLENGLLPSRSIAYLWKLGFGTVTSESIVDVSLGYGMAGLHLSILVANSPQVLLSFLFLTYNGLFTCMLLAHEWSGYAHVRKPLRVTSPAGSQRSTYRLQLPYKYGIPLLVLSGTLHWLVSQSIFLARVNYYNDGVLDDFSGISTLGYSCIAIITVITLGGIVIIIGILHGFRRYKSGVPLVGSCSAAISAACHRPNEDVDAPFKPVMWGAVESSNPVGHCCLTSFEVTKPIKGQNYE